MQNLIKTIIAIMLLMTVTACGGGGGGGSPIIIDTPPPPTPPTPPPPTPPPTPPTPPPPPPTPPTTNCFGGFSSVNPVFCAINMDRSRYSGLDYNSISIAIVDVTTGMHIDNVGQTAANVFGSGVWLHTRPDGSSVQDNIQYVNRILRSPRNAIINRSFSFGYDDEGNSLPIDRVSVIVNQFDKNNVEGKILVFSAGNFIPFGDYSTVAIEFYDLVNRVNGYARTPTLAPPFLGNIVVAAGIHGADENYRINVRSEWCIDIKWWCVVAPFEYNGVRGTSISAPIVSASLGYILAYANGNGYRGITPEVALAVLLTTASRYTYFGDYGPDAPTAGVNEVYGWGRVNVSAAISLIQSSNNNYNRFADGTFYSGSGSNITVSGVRTAFSEYSDWRHIINNIRVDTVAADLSFLSEQLSDIRTVGGFGDSIRYSANFGDMVKFDKPKQINMGQAVEDMLINNNISHAFNDGLYGVALSADKKTGKFHSLSASVGDLSFASNFCDTCIDSVWDNNIYGNFAPAFAVNNNNAISYGKDISAFYSFSNDDISYKQYGFSFNKSVLDIDNLLQFSVINEDDSIAGLNFGGLARTPNATKHFRFSSEYDKLPFGFNLYGGYGTGFVDVEDIASNIIGDFENIRYDSYSLGLEKQRLFSGNDLFRFNIKAEPKIISGKAAVNSYDLGCTVNGDSISNDRQCLKQVFYSGYFKENNPAYNANYTYTHKKTAIDLSGAKRLVTFNVGYSFKPSYNSVAAVGYEANTAKQSAFSLFYRLNL